MKKINFLKNNALYHIAYVLADLACLIGNIIGLKRRFRTCDDSFHKSGICDYRRIHILKDEKATMEIQFGN